MTATVTRAGLAAAVDALRASDPDAAAEQKSAAAMRTIIDAALPSIGTDDRVAHTAYPTSPTSSVVGVLIDVTVTRLDTVDVRSFAVVALAAAEPDGVLAGSVVVTGLPIDSDEGGRTLLSRSVSGDVWVSAPIDASGAGVLRVALTSVTVTPPVSDVPPAAPVRRTAAERAAARKQYDAALRSARAKYAKARKKAGSSKRRRKAAKAAYDKRRARAKAAYLAAVADVPAVSSKPATSSGATQVLGDTTTIVSTDAGWAAAV